MSALRLQVCANVFARSRIHFDATLDPSRGLDATDVAEGPAAAAAGADRMALPTPARRDEQFTIH